MSEGDKIIESVQTWAANASDFKLAKRNVLRLRVGRHCRHEEPTESLLWSTTRNIKGPYHLEKCDYVHASSSSASIQQI